MALPLLEISRVTLLLQRLKALPVWPVEWELDVARDARWVVPAGRAPYRPHHMVCCPRRLAFAGFSERFEAGEPRVVPALESFLWLQRYFGPNQHLPELLYVRDASLAAELEPVLLPLGVGALVVDSLPYVDFERGELLVQTHGGRNARRSFGPRVSIERLYSFALAAADCFHAAPWEHVGESEEVLVCSPDPPIDPRALDSHHGSDAFQSFHVLGALGPHRGIDFACSPADHHECALARRRTRFRVAPCRWRFTFEPIHKLPIADSELWEHFGLPVAAPGAYPKFVRYPARGSADPATPEQIEYLEGVLRAWTRGMIGQLAQGRGERTVRTFSAESVFAFMIPGRIQVPRQCQLFTSPAPGQAYAPHDERPS